jgi:Tfp pilus assembly protein PilF
LKKKAPLKKRQEPLKPVPEKKDSSFGMFLFISFAGALILSFIAFWPILKNGFSNWDDPTYIENNPLIKDFTLSNFKKIFTEIYFSNYQPLHIFSYFIEYRFFKMDAHGYHLVSILMNAIVTALVMWFAWLFSGKKNIAFITGLLFAVHPLHVESVAWVAERKDLLYTIFMFASLIAYLYYVKNSKNRISYAWSLLFFVLSIFSKAMAASLPPLLVLIDFYYSRKFSRKVILEKIPFFLLALVMGSISVYASGRDGSINENAIYTFFDRCILACSNLLMYFVKLIVPHHLSPYYPYPAKTGGMLPWYYYVSPFIVALLIAVTFYSLKVSKKIFFCLVFFYVTIFLVLQLLPVGPTVFSERYSYIPSAAFFMLVAMGIDHLIMQKKGNTLFTNGIYMVLAAYCIWLGIITRDRCRIWKDPDTFWSDVIGKFDDVPIAFNNRGHYYNKMGKKKEAMADFNKAISLNADYDMALFNRGSLYGEMNRLDESMQDLNHALKVNGRLAEAYKMRGQVYAVTGKEDAAMADFKKALELNPGYGEIYFNLGIFYFNKGNKQEACKNFHMALNMHYDKATEMIDKYCK